jgi:hypothetical protein
MARSKRRYYSDEDIERGVTPSDLKRMGRDRQREYMRHWFHRNFEDPANETPYNSREGGYLYIWGGPYSAHEQLFDEFGSLVSEDRIQEAANEIEGEDGIYDWAPGPDHPDKRQREEDWRAEQYERPETADETREREKLEDIIERLKSGAKPSYGDGFEVEQRRAIQNRLEELRVSLSQVTPAHGGMGHNRPPPDEDSPQAVVVVEIRDAEETIRNELAKPQPNALSVANATLLLKSALGWLGKKIDAAADGFAQAFGKTLGVAAATTVAAGGALLFPRIVTLLGEIVVHVTRWLSHVTLPF